MGTRSASPQASHTRHHFVVFSLQYYAAGRFAALNRLYRVAPNLLHHAVECILKATLARNLSLKGLKKYFHDIEALWEEVTKANPGLVTPKRNQTIVALNKFENLRYPDLLLNAGRYDSFRLTHSRQGDTFGQAALERPALQV